jgi:hypothetical protein
MSKNILNGDTVFLVFSQVFYSQPETQLFFIICRDYLTSSQ